MLRASVGPAAVAPSTTRPRPAGGAGQPVRSPSIRTLTPWAVSSADLGGDVFLEQRHQGVDLFRRPLPVLLAEGEEGERLDSRLDRRLDDPPDRRHAGLVPGGRGRFRRSAHRPLPSMMTATWPGRPPEA